MSEHSLTVSWRRDSPAGGEGGDRAASGEPAELASYSRDHAWELPGGMRIQASAAPGYQGNAALLDPEQALVGALASCHMLSFLAIAARRNWRVESYRDAALGYLGRNEQGRTAVTRVVLRPQVAFAGATPDAEELARLHASAHRGCFIAQSVRTRIDLEPGIDASPGR